MTLLNTRGPRRRKTTAMQQDHGHSPQEIARRLSAGNQGAYLKDTIYGAIDGAVTTFAIVAGVAGAGLSHTIILTLGIANILADGFSMAASNYSGTKAQLDDRARIQKIEQMHIRQHRAGELEELRQILALRGLRGDVLSSATDLISRDTPKWIELMLTDEYGLTKEQPRPFRAAASTFLAFMAAGSVPLLPFVFSFDHAFQSSVFATLLTFFVIGSIKSKWSLSPWWRSGLETLGIGATAALIAYGVGGLFHP